MKAGVGQGEGQASGAGDIETSVSSLLKINELLRFSPRPNTARVRSGVGWRAESCRDVADCTKAAQFRRERKGARPPAGTPGSALCAGSTSANRASRNEIASRLGGPPSMVRAPRPGPGRSRRGPGLPGIGWPTGACRVCHRRRSGTPDGRSGGSGSDRPEGFFGHLVEEAGFRSQSAGQRAARSILDLDTIESWRTDSAPYDLLRPTHSQ